jgi:capsid protein
MDIWTFQLLECDQLDLYYNVSRNELGNRVTMGVEMNDFGAPVAYHIINCAMQDIYANTASVMQRQRIAARERRHHNVPDRAR